MANNPGYSFSNHYAENVESCLRELADLKDTASENEYKQAKIKMENDLSDEILGLVAGPPISEPESIDLIEECLFQDGRLAMRAMGDFVKWVHPAGFCANLMIEVLHMAGLPFSSIRRYKSDSMFRKEWNAPIWWSDLIVSA